MNATYKRSGTLWEGRYKVLDAVDYLLRVYREELEAAQQAKKKDVANVSMNPRRLASSPFCFEKNGYSDPERLSVAGEVSGSICFGGATDKR